MLRYARGLRRAAAAALLVVLPVLGWAFAECIIASERADALAVATQPHHTATLIDVSRMVRGGDTYTVEYQGREYELANGYPLDDTIGAPVQIVFRADDPDWAIGVTKSSYWAPDPGADTFFRTAMVATGIVFAAWRTWKLLPDDWERLAAFRGGA
ncbi:hypothetical protein GCM10023081_01620 [Arthrobacter ginkgonis]|uniref:DUF3592 domain-containing protein n=1 Tax=Arthrobacter ginkgonis TaxID=1630594 RepID=A0ABP7BQW8_9MICC